jgi:hypothetical protein
MECLGYGRGGGDFGDVRVWGMNVCALRHGVWLRKNSGFGYIRERFGNRLRIMTFYVYY